jgi:hypothetical protein
MGQAKEIRVAPIAKKDADALIIRLHYSHKTVNNAFLALGVFLNGRLEGAMTFGPSMDKSNILGLVRDTAWNGFLELNRLAFSEALPRNSERRDLDRSADDQKALSAHRMGDLVRRWMPVRRRDDLSRGRFVLTGIKLNKSLLRLPDGSVTHKMTQVTGKNRAKHFAKAGGSWRGQVMSPIGPSSAPHCSISLPQTDRPLAPFDDQGYSFSPIVVSAKCVNGKK